MPIKQSFEQPASEVKVLKVERGAILHIMDLDSLLLSNLDLHHSKKYFMVLRTLGKILIETLSTFGIQANCKETI